MPMQAREHVPRNANQRAAISAGLPTRANAIDELIRDRAAPGGLRQQVQEHPPTAPESLRRGFERGSPKSAAAAALASQGGSPSSSPAHSGANSPTCRRPSLIRRAAEATSPAKPARDGDADARLQQVERIVALHGAVVQQLVRLPRSQQAEQLLAEFEADLNEWSRRINTPFVVSR